MNTHGSGISIDPNAVIAKLRQQIDHLIYDNAVQSAAIDQLTAELSARNLDRATEPPTDAVEAP